MADYGDEPLETQQDILYEQIGFGSPAGDDHLHELFYDYFYNDYLTLNQRVAIYDEMVVRIEELYGIDFDNIWDWEDFRSWYESA